MAEALFFTLGAVAAWFGRAWYDRRLLDSFVADIRRATEEAGKVLE